MTINIVRIFTFLLISAVTALTVANTQADKFIWLEDVEGEKALQWVENQNSKSQSEFEKDPKFKELYSENLKVYQSDERIPYIARRGKYYYNFWRGKEHERGIYRRVTLSEYKKSTPKWETVLDIDAIAEKENENWVYKGIQCLYPKEILCLVHLSRGGADATVIREFNLKTKEFVEKGFYLPEAKSRVSWIDKNTLFVGTNFGEGSLTDSGYPRIVKRWKRGQPLADAEIVYEGNKHSMSATARRSFFNGDYIDYIRERPGFFTDQVFINNKGKWQKINKPESAIIKAYFDKQLFIELKDDWNVNNRLLPSGAIIYAPLADILMDKAHYKILVKNNSQKTISRISFTKNTILVTWLDNVKSLLERYTLSKDGSYKPQSVELNENGSISVTDTSDANDDFMVVYESFLQPDSLYLVDGKTLQIELLKSLPSFFDAKPYRVEQNFVTSKDGTKVPYFVIMAKDVKLNGRNPTLLYGYGGFEISMRPGYSSTVGISWLKQGGIYAIANIRGGGEYGPEWHKAALKKNRHKAYEDFEAIADDLIKRKITSAKHLGIRGGSNGGLLMGAMLTRSPDLFNAIVCQVPLLDMLRYHKLLAGASWMAEYGDPEIEDERAYLASYSPYHNLKKDVPYPRVLFTTSTRDDRVHPGHARKMVAKMQSLGHDVLYYENTEGGHGGAANQKQSAYVNAMVYTYLLKVLK